MFLEAAVKYCSIFVIGIMYIEFLKIIAIGLCSNIETQFTYTNTKAEDRWQRCGRPKLILFTIISLVLVYLYFKYK